MYKALKIELKLTNEQKIQVNKTIGVERFIFDILKDGSVKAVPSIHIKGINHIKAITKAIVVITESVPFLIIFIFYLPILNFDITSTHSKYKIF